ncbi:pentapeptide repeat-containing protein [Paenibacillus polymyxa]|uniref:pentapeptide repeat-containing protein n=1 Tax=Paenibacillus polymyxa TaxID=1406 RepID=UPI002ED27C34|nr:pentapeptide repeat-containing protein [Paenibacillus polymyxa]
MDKQAALYHFKEHHFTPLLDIQLDRLEAMFDRYQAQLISDFKESFRDLCIHILSMQQQGQKEPVGYIHYSFLRTQMLEQSYLYMVEAYSAEWYEDDSDCKLTYDASWAYAPMSIMLEALEKERKIYMGTITSVDVERLMLESAPLFHQFVSSLMRLGMTEVVQMPEYLAIHKADRVAIRTGEYKDISENLYVEDQEALLADHVREQLIHSSEEEPYVYENLKRLSLPHLHLMQKDLRYNDFSHSDLRESQFHTCILIGSMWQRSNLAGGSFQGCLLTDADFRYSNLRDANFSNASGQPYREHGVRVPGLCGLHFEHAILDGADFTDVHSFEHAYFDGASMQGTLVPQKYYQHWKLSEAQLQSIVWTE